MIHFELLQNIHFNLSSQTPLLLEHNCQYEMQAFNTLV
jgi:hypothetical protein